MTITRLRLCLLGAGLMLGACGSSSPTPPSTSPTLAAATDADARAATAVLTAYMVDVAGGNFDGAWARLSPATQAAFGSKEEFAAERTAFAQSTGGIYRLGQPSHNLVLLSRWLSPADPSRPSLARAYLARVDYPRLANNNAGWEILVAAPDPTGEWRIWKAR